MQIVIFESPIVNKSAFVQIMAGYLTGNDLTADGLDYWLMYTSPGRDALTIFKWPKVNVPE